MRRGESTSGHSCGDVEPWPMPPSICSGSMVATSVSSPRTAMDERGSWPEFGQESSERGVYPLDLGHERGLGLGPEHEIVTIRLNRAGRVAGERGQATFLTQVR